MSITMKRGIITNNGQGIHIFDGEVWMTTWEIADLFYTTAGNQFSHKSDIESQYLKGV